MPYCTFVSTPQRHSNKIGAPAATKFLAWDFVLVVNWSNRFARQRMPAGSGLQVEPTTALNIRPPSGNVGAVQRALASHPLALGSTLHRSMSTSRFDSPKPSSPPHTPLARLEVQPARERN